MKESVFTIICVLGSVGNLQSTLAAPPLFAEAFKFRWGHQSQILLHFDCRNTGNASKVCDSDYDPEYEHAQKKLNDVKIFFELSTFKQVWQVCRGVSRNIFVS